MSDGRIIDWFVTATTCLSEFGLSWLIQSTLLIAIGLFAARILRRRGSAVQSAVYRTTLVVTLLCPLAGFVLSVAGVTGCLIGFSLPALVKHVPAGDDRCESLQNPAVVSTPRGGDVPAVGNDGRRAPVPAVVVSASLDSPNPETAASSGATPAVAASPMSGQEAAATDNLAAEPSSAPVAGQPMLWLAGAASVFWAMASLTLLVRLALSWKQLLRLRHSATWAGRQVESVCRDIAEQIDVTAPEVRRSPFLSAPCMTGLRCPVILLPEEPLSMPLQNVLAHELAHLRRHDCHWTVMRRFVVALFWFQPLLWWLSRQIEMTSEDVCDDWVLQFGADRRSYAGRLLELAELGLPPTVLAGVGIVSSPSGLARRIGRILDTSRRLTTGVGRGLWATVVACSLVVTPAVALLGTARQPIAAAHTLEQPNVSATADTTESDWPEWSEPPDGMIRVSGRVLDPDGEPVAGATIRVCSPEEQVGEPVTADRDGSFRVEFRRSDFDSRRGLTFCQQPRIVASAPGFGPAWLERDDVIRKRDHTLRLVKDDVPIRGRVLDAQGNPVPRAEIRTFAVVTPRTGNLDEFLAGWRNVRSYLGGDFLEQTSSVWSRFIDLKVATGKLRFSEFGEPIIVADNNGRFEMAGIGRERVLVFLVKGRNIQTDGLIFVASRPQIENTWERVSRQTEVLLEVRGQYPKFFPASFDYVGLPGRSVTGTIRDRDTKRPVAGIPVTGTGGGNGERTVTDSAGRYVLNLPATADRLNVWVEQAASDPFQPYLGERRNDIPLSPTSHPENMDFELVRGVVARGRVVNAETGEPVHARVLYVAYAENSHAQDLPRKLCGYGTMTRGDGTFQILALPGQGSVAVHATWHDELPPYRPLRPEDFGRPLKDGRVATADGDLKPENFAAVVHINPEPGTEELEVELVVRPGKRSPKVKRAVSMKHRTPAERIGRAAGRYLWRQVEGILDF